MIEDIRTLNRLKIASDAGENVYALMKMYRIWGNKEKLIPQTLQRLSRDRLEKALIFASGLDKASKGLTHQKHAGPLLEKMPEDPWEGLRMLGRLFV